MRRTIVIAVIVWGMATGCTPIGAGIGAGIGYVADGRDGRNDGLIAGTMIGMLFDYMLAKAIR